MTVCPLDTLPDVKVLYPDVHRDGRGSFFEAYHAQRYARAGLPPFVQDNASRSMYGVFRGLHLQRGAAKLVRVSMGEIYDVVVDVRIGSPTFGVAEGLRVDAVDCVQLYVPAGFAHGFLALSEWVAVDYKVSQFYDPEAEITIFSGDPTLDLRLPFEPVDLSPRDREAPMLGAVRHRLPPYGAS